MKQPIRFFSIGLIIASVILFIVMSFVDKPLATGNKLDIDEMITAIKDEGYHVLSASEYITLSTRNDQEDKDEETTENIDEKEEIKDKDIEDDKKEEEVEVEVEEPEVISYTLNVKPNMLGPEISEILEKNNIIKNADDFNRYLETEGYAPYIQLRESKLNSGMSHYEIAEAIARKK